MQRGATILDANSTRKTCVSVNQRHEEAGVSVFAPVESFSAVIFLLFLTINCT